MAAGELAAAALEGERDCPDGLPGGAVGSGIFPALNLRHRELRRLIDLKLEDVRSGYHGV